jgi:hypothetical protein
MRQTNLFEVDRIITYNPLRVVRLGSRLFSVGWLDTALCEFVGNAADFLDRPADQGRIVPG